MKVNFTVSIEFTSREELVSMIISSLTSFFDEKELDSDYESFENVIPENWGKPSVWTDEVIKNFLTYAGGQFLNDNYDEYVSELLNDDNYKHTVELCND